MTSWSTTPTVMGIDPSLSATAICLAGDGEAFASTLNTKPTEPGHLDKLKRMQRIAGMVSASIEVGTRLVMIEELSFHSQGSATRDLAGLWWTLLGHLASTDLTLGVVPPAVLKKWATGNGGAKKFLVGQAIARRWPDVRLHDDNEADALVLASIGLHALGQLPWKPTVHQVEQLARVEWVGDLPSLTEKETAHVP